MTFGFLADSFIQVQRVVILPLADVVPAKECAILLPENAYFTKPWLNELGPIKFRFLNE